MSNPVLPHSVSAGNLNSGKVRLNSSWLKEATYDKDNQQVVLGLKNGKTYLVLPRVKESVFDVFTHTPPGKFVNAHWRDQMVRIK